MLLSLMAMELANTGLKIVALERGENRDTYPDFAFPRIVDELTYGIRLKLFQNASKETVTVRHTQQQTALPCRKFGSFLLGDGVGGAGTHWNGMLWRPLEADLKMRSTVIEKYGANFIPKDMTVQDYPFTYEEMEPYFDKFEKICGASGQAGNLNGEKVEGGNPFEAPRKNHFPTKPLERLYSGHLFADAAKQLGYHPFECAAANCTGPWTNPYNVQLGVCDYCGFCERFGCFNYSKGSPQTCVIPALRPFSNFELRTQAHVISIILKGGQRAVTQHAPTGLTMPDFAWRLDDQEVADVANFIRNGWGNKAQPVTANQVKEIRKHLPQEAQTAARQ